MKKTCDFFRDFRNLGLFVAGASIAALGSALVMQYGFNILPCHLCEMQRKPYWATIALGLLAAIASRKSRRAAFALLLLAGAAFVVNMGISFYHFGTEQKWWPLTVGCVGSLPEGASVEELRKYLENRPIVRCDIPGWTLFGISLTGYNFLLSTALAAFTFYHAVKGHKREAAPKA
jgi:disulfide bond formation protein DsbB